MSTDIDTRPKQLNRLMIDDDCIAALVAGIPSRRRTPLTLHQLTNFVSWLRALSADARDDRPESIKAIKLDLNRQLNGKQLLAVCEDPDVIPWMKENTQFRIGPRIQYLIQEVPKVLRQWYPSQTQARRS